MPGGACNVIGVRAHHGARQYAIMRLRFDPLADWPARATGAPCGFCPLSAGHAGKQVPSRMSEVWSLRAQRSRDQRKPAAAASDALRNSGDGPPNRSPFTPDRPGGAGPNGANQPRGSSFGWLARLFLLVMVLVLAYNLYLWLGPNASGNEIQYKYSDFVTQLDNGNVHDVTITDHQTIEGDLNTQQTYGGVTSTHFKTTYPYADDTPLGQELAQHGVTVEGKYSGSNDIIIGLLINVLPILLIVGILFLVSRRASQSQQNIFNFGRSRAKLIMEDRPSTTFNDIAGVDEAKSELEEVVEFLKTPAKFQRLGGKIPKGVLLVGPPGTGKTLLARAVAGEAGVPFFSMSGSEFVEVLVGVGASRVRDLFDQAKKSAPCIIFIDEIDAVGRKRGSSINSNDEREQTRNQMLVEMDGFDTRQAVVVIAATNRPDGLDKALLRPGRFDRRVTVDRPDWNGRLAILKIHTRGVPLGPDVDLVKVARATVGMVGADLANLVNEAALLAARRNLER